MCEIFPEIRQRLETISNNKSRVFDFNGADRNFQPDFHWNIDRLNFSNKVLVLEFDVDGRFGSGEDPAAPALDASAGGSVTGSPGCGRRSWIRHHSISVLFQNNFLNNEKKNRKKELGQILVLKQQKKMGERIVDSIQLLNYVTAIVIYIRRAARI